MNARARARRAWHAVMVRDDRHAIDTIERALLRAEATTWLQAAKSANNSDSRYFTVNDMRIIAAGLLDQARRVGKGRRK